MIKRYPGPGSTNIYMASHADSELRMFPYLRLSGTPLLSHNLKHFCRTMTSVAPPAFKPFTLTLIQLGSIGSDKAANLQHAREMIMKAAKGNSVTKPQVVVLPVCGQIFSPDISSYSVAGMFQLSLRL